MAPFTPPLVTDHRVLKVKTRLKVERDRVLKVKTRLKVERVKKQSLRKPDILVEGGV